MKRLLAVALAVMMLGVGAAFAEITKFDKKNVEIGVEYNYADKDIKDVELLSIDVPGFASGNLNLVGNKFRLTQELATVGYKLGDLLTPYVVLGISQLDANIHVNGDASLLGWSGGATLLEIPYGKGESAFTWGWGLKGDLIELPAAVKLGYDVRMTAFDNDSNNNVVVLPGIWGQEFAAKSEIKYLEWNALLSASREFKLTKKDGSERKYLQAVTPMVGFKYTRSDTDSKTTVYIGPVTAASQQNVKGDLYSAVLGVSCKVTSNIDVKATGTIGGEKGFNLAAIYKF